MAGYSAIIAYARSWAGGMQPPTWEDLHPELRYAYELAAANPGLEPEQRAAAFRAQVEPLGWTKGAKFDNEKKTCPMIIRRTTREVQYTEPWNLFSMAVDLLAVVT